MPREFKEIIRDRGFDKAKKFYILSFEGHKSEKKYFEALRASSLFNDSGIIETIHLKKNNAGDSDPISVKKLLKDAKSDYNFRKSDEFWLIIDRDDWARIHKIDFDELAKECEAEGNFFIAMSNPCFELWLLLHRKELSSFCKKDIETIFRNPRMDKDWNEILGGNRTYLEKLLLTECGSYSKRSLRTLDYLPHINIAIKNAKILHQDKTEKYPNYIGSHVYLLAEKLIK